MGLATGPWPHQPGPDAAPKGLVKGGGKGIQQQPGQVSGALKARRLGAGAFWGKFGAPKRGIYAFNNSIEEHTTGHIFVSRGL